MELSVPHFAVYRSIPKIYERGTRRLINYKLSLLLPDLNPDLLRNAETQIKNGAVTVSLVDEIACTSSGERVPVQIAVSKVAQNDRWLLVISDLRSKVAVESMKREFIAMLGHDLRTPLSSIRSFIELLLLPGFRAEENPSGAW